MARNPFDEIDHMFDRMSRQIEPLERELFEGEIAVDVKDAGDAFVITADLPGFEREDIDVQLAGERLTISADHTDVRDDEREGRYVRKERHHQSVSRTITVPEPVAEHGTEASYNNGVLTVTLSKAEADDGHDIPIN